MVNSQNKRIHDIKSEIEIELIFDDKELDLSTRQADIGIYEETKTTKLYSKKIN